MEEKRYWLNNEKEKEKGRMRDLSGNAGGKESNIKQPVDFKTLVSTTIIIFAGCCRAGIFAFDNG